MSRIKLTRKQKLLRNLLLAAICLLLLAWMWDFPSFAREGLLRRAERQFFLEGSEILFVGNEEDVTTLYAQNGTTLLAVSGELMSFGWRLTNTEIDRQEDGILCIAEDEMDGELRYLVFGNVAHAARAELEVFLDVEWTSNGVYLGHLQETYTAQGERIAPGGFVFTLARHYDASDISPPARVEQELFDSSNRVQRERPVLRLYDEHDKLIYEKEMKNLDPMYHAVWPEVEE